MQTNPRKRGLETSGTPPKTLLQSSLVIEAGVESALISQEARQLSSGVEDRLIGTSKAFFPLSIDKGRLAFIGVEVLATWLDDSR